MELTDEQFGKVLRYVDREMDAAENKAFESVLMHNIALQDEVKFYKELRSLSESIGQKISPVNKGAGEVETGADEVLRMIKQARANWEINHKNDLRQEDVTQLREVKNIPSEEYLNIIEINGNPLPVSEKGNVMRLVKEEDKVKRIYLAKWLAAAVLTGVICIGITFLYFQNNNADSRIVYNKKEPNSKVVIENKKPETRKENNNLNTTSSQVNDSASHNASSHSNIVQNRIKIEKAERERLVVKNFERDNLPSLIPDPLEDPSAFYKDHKTKDAITAYRKVLADIKEAEISDLIVRGEDEQIELIAFYAHYYLAQCYMSINNTTNSLQELENAIKIAPDTVWKNKVQWYLALAYLKTGRIQRAKTLLNEVAANDQAYDYKQKAIKLIKELKKE